MIRRSLSPDSGLLLIGFVVPPCACKTAAMMAVRLTSVKGKLREKFPFLALPTALLHKITAWYRD
jgi:hypothetical protein